MRASSREIADLAGDMPEKVQAVVAACKHAGVDLLVYATLRNCRDQAILYRRTRTWREIEARVKKLDEAGFYALARVLNDVGPQSGPLGKHVTWAAPGQSWHQYGLAIDAVPMVNGKPDWDVECHQAWETYASCAENAGLYWAGRWVEHRELFHSQGPPGGDPLKVLDGSPAQIEDMLIGVGAL